MKCDIQKILKQLSAFTMADIIKKSPCLQCTLDFLGEYSAMAQEEKPTDQQLKDLSQKTVTLVTKAMEKNRDNITSTSDQLKWRGQEYEETSLPEAKKALMDEIKHAEFHADIQEKIEMILQELGTERIDMLLTIERFANLAHDQGPVLPQYSCGCEEEDMGVEGYMAAELTRVILKCLAE